jgi:hypothetical protein
MPSLKHHQSTKALLLKWHKVCMWSVQGTFMKGSFNWLVNLPWVDVLSNTKKETFRCFRWLHSMALSSFPQVGNRCRPPHATPNRAVRSIVRCCPLASYSYVLWTGPYSSFHLIGTCGAQEGEPPVRAGGNVFYQGLFQHVTNLLFHVIVVHSKWISPEPEVDQ